MSVNFIPSRAQTLNLSRTVVICWIVWLPLWDGVYSDFQVSPLPALRENLVNLINGTGLIPVVCQATRYPDVCSSALATDSRSGAANSTELVRISIDLGLTAQLESSSLIQGLVNTGGLDVNTTSATAVCEETLSYGAIKLATCRDSLMVNPVEDIQAWLSAALQFQYDCYSSLVNVANAPPTVTAQVLPQVNYTMQLISNALCMTDALAIYGSAPSSWMPPPEIRPINLTSAFFTDTNPEWSNQSDSCLLGEQFGNLTPNVTVSQDGLSNYSSVQDAVDSAPTYSTDRYTIYIKAGVYNESIRVHQNKTSLAFVGDGTRSTFLTGNRNAYYPGTSTFQTATVAVVGQGFMARDITFQNSAGPYLEQAVAIRVDSDLSAFQGCLFDGYQDTLYAHTGRQFYTNCTILGTIDFIFGNAAAVFQNCMLAVRVNRPESSTSTFTAQGRIDPGQTTGLVFQSCTVTGTPDYLQAVLLDPAGHKAYLGRPWKLFSRTILINTYLDFFIDQTGWFPWNGDFALDSLLYGEYASFGPGAVNISSRVQWSNQLTEDEAEHFSVDEFIQGDWWLPCTGILFTNFSSIST